MSAYEPGLPQLRRAQYLLDFSNAMRHAAYEIPAYAFRIKRQAFKRADRSRQTFKRADRSRQEWIDYVDFWIGWDNEAPKALTQGTIIRQYNMILSGRAL